MLSVMVFPFPPGGPLRSRRALWLRRLGHRSSDEPSLSASPAAAAREAAPVTELTAQGPSAGAAGEG